MTPVSCYLCLFATSRAVAALLRFSTDSTSNYKLCEAVVIQRGWDGIFQADVMSDLGGCSRGASGFIALHLSASQQLRCIVKLVLKHMGSASPSLWNGEATWRLADLHADTLLFGLSYLSCPVRRNRHVQEREC